jgi:hypothetical protein
LSFLKEIFSECDGCASFGRVACAVTIPATLGFLGLHLYWKHEFPTYDIIIALSILMTAPYGTNKLSEAISNVKDMIVARKQPATTPVVTVEGK